MCPTVWSIVQTDGTSALAGYLNSALVINAGGYVQFTQTNYDGATVNAQVKAINTEYNVAVYIPITITR